MVQPINSPSAGIPLHGEPTATETDLRPKPAVAPAPAGETVLLSAEASILPAALKSGPPVDLDRVSRLRDSISDGSYRPDPQRIADSLTQNIVELLG